MSFKNRMTKPKRQYNLPYWVKNRKAVLEPEWFKKWFGETSHKATYTQKSYSETVDVISGKYNGWKEVSYRERSLKKRHRAYGRKMIAEQLLFMQEMKPCSYCGSDFCENPLSCKDEEEMLREIENHNYEVEDYLFHNDEWKDDYEYDYYADDDYWY